MSLSLLPLIAAGCFGGFADFADPAPASVPIVLAAAETARPAASRPAAPQKPATKPAAVTTPPAAAVSETDEVPEGLAFQDIDDKTLVDRVLAAIEGISTLQSDFTQVAPSGAASTGKFYLRRPGLLRFEYDQPTPLLIVATGGTVFVRDEALETTDSYPVGKTPLKYLLKKRVELGDAKVVSVHRGEDTVAVTFSSEKEETDGQLTVVVKGEGLQLSEWIVRDPRNGVTFVKLANVILGKSLPNRLFAAPETGSAFLKD
jgi:outer membrane lipoprotein-sorting protein